MQATERKRTVSKTAFHSVARRDPNALRGVARTPESVGSSRGTFVAVGGAEDKRDDMRILRRALAHVPGQARRIEVIPTASREPELAAAPYLPAFRALGASHVHVLDIRARDQAAWPAAVERIRDADLVYMTGGDQALLAATLAGTPVVAAMHEKLREGGVIAGTSAGAAALSATMIAQGSATLRKGSTLLAEGLGLLPDVILDTHFTERGRFGRLIEAVATHPGLLGVGIGENTAIVVRDGEAEVIGAGNVVVMDAREMRGSNVHQADHDKPIHAERLILHTYAEGGKFRLDSRMVVPLAARRRRVRN